MSKMVNILSIWSKLIMTIKDTINEIKLEERKIADRENAIHNAAPQVSVAT